MTAEERKRGLRAAVDAKLAAHMEAKRAAIDTICVGDRERAILAYMVNAQILWDVIDSLVDECAEDPYRRGYADGKQDQYVADQQRLRVLSEKDIYEILNPHVGHELFCADSTEIDGSIFIGCNECKTVLMSGALPVHPVDKEDK